MCVLWYFIWALDDVGLFFQGAYRDDSGQPMVLDAVRVAEERICGSHFME